MAIETILAQTLQEVAKVPRQAEIEAGIVLAVLGFTMTFVILSILTVSIKLMSMAVTRYVKWKESRKRITEAAVEAPAAPAPTPVAPAAPSAEMPVPPEVIAAAIAGVRAYMEEKMGRRRRRERYAPVNYWVLAWRMEAGFNLNDLDYLAWNKSRKPRW